jgi:23S rRNA methylase
MFKIVEYFKPKSSRQESSEIFIIAKEFKLDE